MIKVFIGIDPGKSGAVAVLTRSSVEVIAMPLAGKRIDIAYLSDWIYDRARHGDAIACLEKVFAMRRGEDGRSQGAVSAFSFGFGTGSLYGMLITLRIPVYEPSPQTWKKLILADTPKDKQAAIEYCTKVYPNISLYASSRCRKPHSGMADAICIARYAMEKYKDVL